MELIEGYEFELVELETFIDKNMSRPRVRPLRPFPAESASMTMSVDTHVPGGFCCFVVDTSRVAFALSRCWARRTALGPARRAPAWSTRWLQPFSNVCLCGLSSHGSNCSASAPAPMLPRRVFVVSSPWHSVEGGCSRKAPTRAAERPSSIHPPRGRMGAEEIMVDMVCMTAAVATVAGEAICCGL